MTPTVRSRLRLGWLIAAWLLAAGGASAAPGTGQLPADLALVPRDGLGFLAIRVAEVAGAVEKLATDDPTLNEMLRSLDEKGLPVSAVERAVWIFQTDGAFAITFIKPFDKPKMLKSLVDQPTERKAGGKTFQADLKQQSACYFADERTILLGTPKAVQDVLERLAGPKGPPALDAALALAAEKHFLVAGLNPDQVGDRDLAPALKPFLPLLQARATLVVELEAQAWTCTVRFPFANDEAAAAGEKAARRGLDVLKEQLALAITAMKDVPADSPHKAANESARQLFLEVETGFKTATVTRAGLAVEGTIRAPSDDPKRSGGLVVQSLGAAVILFRPSPTIPRPTSPRPEKPPEPGR